jgi:lipopolysaccharide/colanic/teichoic acid biosynthesis glycosyltransferase
MLYELTKRLIDIVLSLVGLILIVPLLILVSLWIKLDSTGPVFYTPTRVGRFGKPFKMYKFRSMVMTTIGGRAAHAEEILKKDQDLLDEYKKNSYKLKNDPRVTRVGRFIRKYSVDELPQIINVLRGEMSIVGPRAYMPDELLEQQDAYPESKQYVATLLNTKPGLTGPWQVGGRSNINFDQRVRMDAGYALRRSLFYDIKIILKTVPAVIKADGAT